MEIKVEENINTCVNSNIPNDIDYSLDSIDFTEKMDEVDEIKLKLDYKFIEKYGIIKLYFVKFQLKRYIKKQEKYSKLLQKYEMLYRSLSLAVISGFDSTKKHIKYLKELSKKNRG